MTGKDWLEKYGGDSNCVITALEQEYIGIDEMLEIKAELDATLEKARELAQAFKDSVVAIRFNGAWGSDRTDSHTDTPS